MWRSMLVVTVMACGGAKPAPAPPPAPVQADAPPAPAPAPTTADTGLATVNGEPLTEAEVLMHIPPQRQAEIAQISDPELRANQLAEAKLAAIDPAIDHHLLVAAAIASGARITDAELDSTISEIARANNLTPADLEAVLVKEGLTIEAYRAFIRDELLINKLLVAEKLPNEAPEAVRPRLVAKYRERAVIEKQVRPN